MNITRSVDEMIAHGAREAAQKMGKGLNQALRDDRAQSGRLPFASQRRHNTGEMMEGLRIVNPFG